MTNYMSSYDLKKAYKMLRLIEDAIRDGNDNLAKCWVAYYAGKSNNPAPAEFVVELKRKIREATKRVNNYRIVSGDYDYYVELIECPEEIQTVDAARDYFYDNFYREYFPEPWDCTGQLFTNWYHIAQRRGRMIIYHSVSRDV